jgi:glycine betaine/proline transport system substrate-binding protein
MFRSQRRCGRSLLAGLIVLILASLAACSGQSSSFGGGGGSGGQSGGGDTKTVKTSVIAGWDDSIAAGYLWKELLEQHGYTVNIQELDIASTYTGVANGQLDFYLDTWLPVTHQSYWKRYQNQLEVLSSWGIGKNMLAVPDYVDISSVADLKGKSSEFNGRIVGIEAGAGEMKAVREKVMPAYGLGEYQLIEGSSPAMYAELDTAIKSKQPIVVTLWQPHWAFSRWPIKALEDPQTAFGQPDEIQAIATKGFGASHPELAGWMKNFKLTPDQLGSLMLKVQEGGKGNEQAAAKQWITENQQVVDGWFTTK